MYSVWFLILTQAVVTEQRPIELPHPPKGVIVVYRSIQNPHRPGIAWATRTVPTADHAAHRPHTGPPRPP